MTLSRLIRITFRIITVTDKISPYKKEMMKENPQNLEKLKARVTHF